MTSIDEQLSRLLSDDLPEAEAAALRARIASEPEVARRWQRLRDAVTALEALPAERSPPPLRIPAPPRRTGWTRALPWAVAAAAVLLWVGARPSGDRVLLSGTEWVDGRVRVLAADVAVDVDGRAEISVEPARGVARGGGPTEDAMIDRKSVVSALAGAAVTVVVLEGQAVVHPGSAGAEAVVVRAGEPFRTGAVPASPPPTPSAPAPTPEDHAERLAKLQADLEAAQQALAQARFEGAVTRGQLEAMQGTVSEWPADVPEALSPARFRENLEAKLAGLPDVKVADVDCSEYPCVAAVQYTGQDPDHWMKPVTDAIKAWYGDLGVDHLAMQVAGTNVVDGEGHETTYAVIGASDGAEGDVGTRTGFRIQSLVGDLGAATDERRPGGAQERPR